MLPRQHCPLLVIVDIDRKSTLVISPKYDYLNGDRLFITVYLLFFNYWLTFCFTLTCVLCHTAILSCISWQILLFFLANV